VFEDLRRDPGDQDGEESELAGLQGVAISSPIPYKGEDRSDEEIVLSVANCCGPFEEEKMGVLSLLDQFHNPPIQRQE